MICFVLLCNSHRECATHTFGAEDTHRNRKCQHHLAKRLHGLLIPINECMASLYVNIYNSAGDSAGGNFAAAVSLKFRNERIKPKLKMQVLIYPALQAVDFNTPSYQEMRDDPYLDRAWMISALMWHAFGNMPTSMLVGNTR